MEIRINENIRKYRKDKNLTQESLAAMLSITPQSVSKWERGDGYPDITILPALANCLGVTIDVLLGNDTIVTEERINSYIAEYKNLTSNDETHSKAFSVAEKAYEEFSYDYRIMMLYVNALKLFRPNYSKEEIEKICRTVLQSCDDPVLLSDASYHICGFRNADDRLAFLKKYIDYGQDWNWFNIYPMDSEEGKIMMQHEIADKWWHLNAYIDLYGDFFCEKPNRTVSHEERIALIKKCQKIFYAVFDEDDLGEYTFYVGQHNEFLAREYAALGMKEETIIYFEKAVDGWIEYNNLPKEYTYKNILLNHKPYENGDAPYAYLERYKHDIDTNPDYDFMRDDERFIATYEKLTNK